MSKRLVSAFVVQTDTAGMGFNIRIIAVAWNSSEANHCCLAASEEIDLELIEVTVAT